MTEGVACRLRALVSSVLLTVVVFGCASPAPGPSQPSLVTASPVPVAATPAIPPSPAPSTAAPTVPATLGPGPSSSASTFLSAAEPRTDLDLGISCDGPIGEGDIVAIVDLDPTDEERLSLRDYADIANPRTVCTMKVRPTALIDARHIVVQHCPTGEPCSLVIVDLPEVQFHWYRPPVPWDFRQELVAISPRLDSVAWISTNEDYTRRSVHVADASGDHAIADLAEVGGRCGSPDDSNIGRYTRDGSHVFVLDQPIAPSNRLFVAEGHDLRFSLVPPANGTWAQDEYPAMALWAPTSPTLFYRQDGDVLRWTPAGGVESFLPGVRWTSPSLTPDGRHLAYAVPNGTGHDVFLMDPTKPGSQKRIATGRAGPTFVNDRQLWYVSETPGDCTGGGQPKRLIYDIETGKEASSIIDSVAFIWPGTSATN